MKLNRALWLVVVGLWSLLGARDARAAQPVIVVGLDGLEMRVLQQMMSDGELPTFRKLSSQGFLTHLATDYGSRSPVVWTTVATGHEPSTHGITDFLSTSSETQVPVSSSDRQVKAIWNIASEANRRVMVLGWWASWPAEPINGLMITDRVSREGIEDTTWPASYAHDLASWSTQADRAYESFYAGSDFYGPDDRLFTWVATHQPAEGPFDLAMVYLHRVDVTAHQYWKYFEPDRFDTITPEGRRTEGALFFDAYRGVDRALKEIVDAAPEEALIIVLSDHGFKALEEQNRVSLSIERVLSRLGYWSGTGTTPDMPNTRVYPRGSHPTRVQKCLVVNLQGREAHGVVPSQHKDRLVARLEEDLAAVTYEGTGAPVFEIDETPAKPECDLTANVPGHGATGSVVIEGTVYDDPVLSITLRTGGHTARQPGVLMMVGPQVQPGATLDEPTIRHITPTVLMAMELPVGDDMTGRPLVEAFRPAWVQAHPVRSQPTWEDGAREGTRDAHESDEDILEELRAIGYIE